MACAMLNVCCRRLAPPPRVLTLLTATTHTPNHIWSAQMNVYLPGTSIEKVQRRYGRSCILFWCLFSVLAYQNKRRKGKWLTIFQVQKEMASDKKTSVPLEIYFSAHDVKKNKSHLISTNKCVPTWLKAWKRYSVDMVGVALFWCLSSVLAYQNKRRKGKWLTISSTKGGGIW